MATFRIGQRVKKVSHILNYADERCAATPAPIGSVGAITSIGDYSGYLRDGTPVSFVYMVKYDNLELERVANSYMLEPIQYDGMQKIEWSQCMWLPEHMREKLDENVKEAA